MAAMASIEADQDVDLAGTKGSETPSRKRAS
jgi:hypothetical protein